MSDDLQREGARQLVFADAAQIKGGVHTAVGGVVPAEIVAAVEHGAVGVHRAVAIAQRLIAHGDAIQGDGGPVLHAGGLHVAVIGVDRLIVPLTFAQPFAQRPEGVAVVIGAGELRHQFVERDDRHGPIAFAVEQARFIPAGAGSAALVILRIFLHPALARVQPLFPRLLPAFGIRAVGLVYLVSAPVRFQHIRVVGVPVGEGEHQRPGVVILPAVPGGAGQPPLQPRVEGGAAVIIVIVGQHGRRQREEEDQ